jgi:catechol 2,3-dioxygenase-like lactoylglutathione lyase family enzyme
MRIDAVVVDCGDAVRLARFWAEALGWTPEDDPEDELSIMVEPPEDEAFLPMLLFAEVPEAKHGKNRVHLDVVAEDGVDDEVIRLEAIGATLRNWAEEEGHVWAVMLDPEGNEFCVMPPEG